MKTKMTIRLAAILFAGLTIFSTGCKKDEQNNDSKTKSLEQLSKDQVTVDGASADMLNDVNKILSGGNGKSLESLPCNVTVVSSSITNDTITYAVTFNGLNCEGTYNRTGNAQIKKNVNTHWTNAGATVKIILLNLKITKVATGEYVILNGYHIFENVTGGNILNLGNNMTSIVHKISGSIEATFSDNTTLQWNVSRQMTFSGSFGQYVVTEDGFGSEASYSNLLVWGTSRQGEVFYTQIK